MHHPGFGTRSCHSNKQVMTIPPHNDRSFCELFSCRSRSPLCVVRKERRRAIPWPRDKNRLSFFSWCQAFRVGSALLCSAGYRKVFSAPLWGSTSLLRVQETDASQKLRRRTAFCISEFGRRVFFYVLSIESLDAIIRSYFFFSFVSKATKLTS